MAGALERAVASLIQPEGGPRIDFRAPLGEPALVAPDSVSWRVFKNPVALFIGGAAAVLLELAEPRVRSGVWDHSSFKSAPLKRLQRTGLAAMVTVYGARSVAEAMIAGVGRLHGRVTGVTPGGQAYRADDPDLLNWVQATASFGFLEAYHSFVAPLSAADRDRFYAEGGAASALYGATGAPRSEAEREAQFAAMLPRLEASDIVFEFLDIMRATPLLPAPLHLLQRPLLRAAVSLVPPEVREVLGLGPAFGLRPLERRVIRLAGAAAERAPIAGTPAVEACLRLGLPGDYLFRRPREVRRVGV
jgi:uncharacterized protein (DUF2236 family)